MLVFRIFCAFVNLQELVQSHVLEAKIFHSPYGTGIAVLSGTYRFILATNIEDIKLRRLPEVPGTKSTRFFVLVMLSFTKSLFYFISLVGLIVWTVTVRLLIFFQVYRGCPLVGLCFHRTDRPRCCWPLALICTSWTTLPAHRW